MQAELRKRQNGTLRKQKAKVMELLQRALEPFDSAEVLCNIYSEVSDALASLGLAIGGSEALDERLFILHKGELVFSEPELDMAESAARRLELMYYVDLWTRQLDARLHAARRLLNRGPGATKAERERVLEVVSKEGKESLNLHGAVFRDSIALKLLREVNDANLPHRIPELGEGLLSYCGKLLEMAIDAACELATASLSVKTASIRRGSACAVATSIAETLRPLLAHAQERGGLEPTAERSERLSQAERLVIETSQTGTSSDEEDG